ncbi:serine-rich coiled-coil domain-containing protein 2 isoform X1 [Strigops habroptila]|uniref:serine-rich coiled-coil domain-containing protein 2 isoform X1 n=1 Tax=Strigops habroptila TaxID=2489341 RepID=UPI0011D00C2B|nr:serine-rich coiled-coil domain-containing protein 2 isoform X1 [Strigops habroptila]XP_030343319.1 serine-rich coiled-coil domain-containing protein 2 isoform X1 [Strigops habroptila]XP_030343320.1 serine-rich coiled-coil domain-containing protein 2 isoform X1 [Strigops habroptila]
MEEKNQIRTSLVSRLPKYGTKTLGSVLQPVPNGTAVSLTGNNGGKSFSKHNGTVRMSSFSFNWKKSNKYQLHDQNGRDTNPKNNCNEKLIDSEKYSQSQGASGNDVLRVGLNSTASITSKAAKQTNMFVSSTEELNPKSLPGLSSSAKFAKGALSGRTSYSGLNAPKSHLNGFYGNRTVVGLQRPRANSSSTRTKSGEGLAQSTDNSKTFSCEKMVRSQSFSHSIQNSFLPTASLTRSHSFNKAVDLTRPYHTQNLAARTSQRSTLLSRNACQLDVPNGNEPMKYGFARPYSGMSAPCSKKPPLSNGSGSAPSFGYRLSRPSLLKPTRQRFAGNIDSSKSTTPDTCIMENSEISTNRTIEKNSVIESNAQRTESDEGLHESMGKHGSKVMCMSDDGDEISISSLSSSEKIDLSEDFSDDFIDMEDPNRTIQIQQKDNHLQELDHGNTMSVEPFISLKESGGSCCNADEWLDINMSAVDDNSESTKHTAENVISPEMNYRAGSSFELSPSDSSDGTYMWDEEGLEPIGSVHPCGSYESSEMNSIDILNNLDSCDLEDDDLMLDVDLPEDPSHDKEECENMSRYDRQDRNARQHQEGFWKRAPQQRWNTQDHYHLGHTDHYIHGKNDLNRGSNYLESPVDHFESYGAPNFYQAPRQVVGLPENTVMLDEMTLRHMVQDCTAVKTQLLKLKRLLHQNDENMSLQDIRLSVPSSPELQEPESTFKMDDLLNEIRQLKDELKKKDETINQLEHQLATRCNCQKDSQKPTGATRTYADKFTQTSWRRSSPQVLQPSSSLPSSTDLAQGKLIKMPHIEAHSEYPKHGLHENSNHQNQNAADVSLTNSLNNVNSLVSMQLNMKDENASYLENLKNKNTEDHGEVASNKEGTLLSRSCFQTSTQADAREVQTELAVKGQPSFTNQASRPKTLRIAKPPNALVPPTMAVLAPSANHSAASKERELLPLSSSAQLQPTSGQDNLKGKQSQKVSKLRPPTTSFVKSKQVSSQKSTPVSTEPQNTCLKTNIPKPPVQRKENVQTQNTGLHSGDSLSSNRHSRLPKPKTH